MGSIIHGVETKIAKWQEISRKTVLDMYGRGVEKVHYVLPNGKEADFYIKKEGPVACVLAMTKGGQVILVRQFRPGPGEMLCELPGGYIDPNENPETAICRELMEETGYKGDVKLVTKCFNDAYSTIEKYCFVATNCEQITEPGMDGHEFVEVVLVSLEDFRQSLRQGQMTDVEVGYLGLDFLGLC